MVTTNKTIKSWMTVGLVASALALSACGKQDETPMETEAETTVDAQTPVEDNATASDSDDIAVASADEGMDVTNNDDVAVATAEDADMLDGTEDSEHVSTY